MSKDKSLRYRTICPYCNKPFDSRTAYNYNGMLICEDCRKQVLRFGILNDYRK